MAVLGLRFCARAFSSCGKREPLFIMACGPLTIAAPLVAEHRLQTRRLSSCGSRAQLLLGMWDPHRPGLEPVSPALAGRFSTTALPGKPPCPVLHLGLESILSLFLCMVLASVLISFFYITFAYFYSTCCFVYSCLFPQTMYSLRAETLSFLSHHLLCFLAHDRCLISDC